MSRRYGNATQALPGGHGGHRRLRRSNQSANVRYKRTFATSVSEAEPLSLILVSIVSSAHEIGRDAWKPWPCISQGAMGAWQEMEPVLAYGSTEYNGDTKTTAARRYDIEALQPPPTPVRSRSPSRTCMTTSWAPVAREEKRSKVKWKAAWNVGASSLAA